MKQILALFFLLFFQSSLTSQSIGINNSGTAPDQSAMLDIQSTSKGMLVPRMTSIQRTDINTPADGLLVFDTQTSSFWFYNGTDWEDLSAEGVSNQITDADGDTRVDVEAGLDLDQVLFY